MSNEDLGKWTKYAWPIVIVAFAILMISAVVSFILMPSIGMATMFVPLIIGFIILGFVWYNRDKFSRV